MMTDDPLIRELLESRREIAVQLAPELRARPFYVESTRLFEGLPTPSGHCLGWAFDKAITEWQYADRLGERYQGPGPIIALDGGRILEASQPGQFERVLTNVLIHETGHILPPRPPRVDLPRSPELEKFQRDVMATRLKLPAPEFGAPGDSHGADFARRCCHLLYRACAAGIDVPAFHLFGTDRHFGAVEEYLTLLLPECIKMAGSTFSEIESTDPPAGFTELWNANLAEHRQREAHFERNRKL
jgi:hypothetical protein